MDLYSGVDANGNLVSDPNFRWHHSDQKNAVEVQNATNALNVALAYQANQWNLEQWEREKEYNSPANQLKLLQEAGLNPLFYGQGLGANSSTQAPQSADLSVAGDFYQSQEQAKMANVASLLGSLGDQAGNIYDQFVRNKELSLASDRLDIERNEAKSRIILNYSKSDETKASARSLLKGLDVSDATIDKIRQDIAESQYYCKKLDQDFRSGKIQNDFLEKTFNTRVARESLQNRLMSANIGLTEEQANYVSQQFLTEVEKTKLTQDQTAHQQIQNAIDTWTRDHMNELHIDDLEKARLLGNLYGFTNDMIGADELREEARKPVSKPKHRPSSDYDGEVITYPYDNQSRSSRNPW